MGKGPLGDNRLPSFTGSMWRWPTDFSSLLPLCPIFPEVLTFLREAWERVAICFQKARNFARLPREAEMDAAPPGRAYRLRGFTAFFKLLAAADESAAKRPDPLSEVSDEELDRILEDTVRAVFGE